MRRIIHNLGRALPQRWVKELVADVADPAGRHRGERIYYRSLTDREEPVYTNSRGGSITSGGGAAAQ